MAADTRMVSRSRAEEIKSKVSIPSYFDKIIIPQMGSYYDLYPVDFDIKPVACCPLHDEDTPSFRFYPDTSSFYCFGCQKGGNIINLHRYFTESITGTMPSYEEALDFLYGTFISGQSLETSVIQPVIIHEKKSTDKELIMYNIYRSDIEKSLMIDKQIPYSTKLKVCETLDKIDVLISKDLVNATEAKTWIRDYIKQSIQSTNELIQR